MWGHAVQISYVCLWQDIPFHNMPSSKGTWRRSPQHSKGEKQIHGYLRRMIGIEIHAGEQYRRVASSHSQPERPTLSWSSASYSAPGTGWRLYRGETWLDEWTSRTWLKKGKQQNDSSKWTPDFFQLFHYSFQINVYRHMCVDGFLHSKSLFGMGSVGVFDCLLLGTTLHSSLGQPAFHLFLVCEVWVEYFLLAWGNGLWPGPSQSERCFPWPQWIGSQDGPLRIPPGILLAWLEKKCCLSAGVWNW